MRRRFWFGLLPLACCLAVAASAGCKGCNKSGTQSGTTSGTSSSSGSGSSSSSGSGTMKKFICPRVLYADFKTYRSWYAEECPTPAWVNLNTTKTTPAMCPGTGTECVEFTKGKEIKRYAASTAAVYHHDSGLESGIVKASKSQIVCPPVSIPTGHTITKDKQTHAYLETSPGGTKVFVMLYRVTISGPGKPTQTFGVGIEVTEDPGASAPVVAHSQIVQPTAGKVVTLKHPAGMDEYEIVVDTSTVISP